MYFCSSFTFRILDNTIWWYNVFLYSTTDYIKIYILSGLWEDWNFLTTVCLNEHSKIWLSFFARRGWVHWLLTGSHWPGGEVAGHSLVWWWKCPFRTSAHSLSVRAAPNWSSTCNIEQSGVQVVPKLKKFPNMSIFLANWDMCRGS